MTASVPTKRVLGTLSYEVDESPSHVELKDSCNNLVYRLTTAWSIAKTTKNKTELVKEYSSKVLVLCQHFEDRQNKRELAVDIDLEGINLLFKKLQSLDFFRYSPDRTEAAFLKRFNLKDLRDRSKNHKNSRQDDERRKAITGSYWKLQGNSIAAQTCNAERLLLLMQNKGVNWILQLSNLARKVDRTAAERVICFIILDEEESNRRVNSVVLGQANRLIYGLLSNCGWTVSSHQSNKFDLSLQARNSAVILENIQDHSDSIRLDESWNIVSASSCTGARLTKQKAHLSNPKPISKRQRLSRSQNCTAQIDPLAAPNLPGPAVNIDLAGEEHENSQETCTSVSHQESAAVDSLPSLVGSCADRAMNGNNAIVNGPPTAAKLASVQDGVTLIDEAHTEEDEVGPVDQSEPTVEHDEADLTMQTFVVSPSSDTETIEEGRINSETRIEEDEVSPLSETEAASDHNGATDETHPDQGEVDPVDDPEQTTEEADITQSDVPSTPSSPSSAVCSSSNKPALTAASLVSSPVATAPKKRYLSACNLRFPVKKDLRGLRDAMNSIPMTGDDDEYARCALELFFDSYFDTP